MKRKQRFQTTTSNISIDKLWLVPFTLYYEGILWGKERGGGGEKEGRGGEEEKMRGGEGGKEGEGRGGEEEGRGR